MTLKIKIKETNFVFLFLNVTSSCTIYLFNKKIEVKKIIKELLKLNRIIFTNFSNSRWVLINPLIHHHWIIRVNSLARSPLSSNLPSIYIGLDARVRKRRWAVRRWSTCRRSNYPRVPSQVHEAWIATSKPHGLSDCCAQDDRSYNPRSNRASKLLLRALVDWFARSLTLVL